MTSLTITPEATTQSHQHAAAGTRRRRSFALLAAVAAAAALTVGVANAEQGSAAPVACPSAPAAWPAGRANGPAPWPSSSEQTQVDIFAASTEPVDGAGWPPARSFPVRECLLTILNEEWEHRLYAERDLDALEEAKASD